MKEYKANPLGKGNNKLFPPKIEIHENGVKYIQQGVFSGNEFFVPFSEINGVSISTPLIGFASVKIYGGKFSYLDAISGFTNNEAREIQNLIELGRKNPENLIKELNDEDWDDDEDEDDEDLDEDVEDEEDEDEDEEDLDEEDEDEEDDNEKEEPQATSKEDKAAPIKTPVAPPPPPPTFSFYALIDNKQYGPYNKIQFKRLVDNDMVNRDTLVWKEGMEQWQAAKDVPDMEEFFPKRDSSTPPPPPPSPTGPPPPPIG